MAVSEHIIIDGKPYKQYTARGMLFGQVAEVPATPFAQKRGQGDTTLADSLTLSYFGMDSFHGGRGQDKARSPFAFMDSKRMITFLRDRAIPAPKVFTLGGGSGIEHSSGDGGGKKLGIYPPGPTVESAFSESFVCPAGGETVDTISFYMRKSSVGVTFNVEFALYDDSSGLPNTKLRSVTMTPADFETSYQWVKGEVTSYALTPSATYHVVVEQLGYGDPFDLFYGVRNTWNNEYPAGSVALYTDAWAAGDANNDLWFKINAGQVLPDVPRHAIEFYGSELVHDKEKKNSSLSYTTENGDYTFSDDLQDFSEWETTSGDAEFIIRVYNSDDTVSWGYLGVKVSATEIKVYQDRNRATTGWKGDDPSGKTPETYEVKNTVMIPNTLFVAMGKGVYYSDETPEGGIATDGGSDYLKDAKASFGVDTYNTGYTLYLVGGEGVGQAADILDTAENQLTINGTWAVNPDRTTRYIVRKEVPNVQASKTNFKYNITSMEIFKDKLYVAQGWRGGRPVWTLSGYSPTADWNKVTGVRAEHLFVHINADGDEALWRSRGHRIDCSTDGENFGDVIEVGDRSKWVTGMTVYAGDFIVFKEDGWYLIDLEEWKAERIIDFTKQPEVDAFKAHCEHAGEYYGGKGGGVWRYTPGPDMTPVGPDRGAVEPDLYSGRFRPLRWPRRSRRDPIRHGSGWGLPEIRLGKVRALVSGTNFLFAAMDARRRNRYSSILVYNRMGWHEIVRASAKKDRMLLLHYSPEISPEPRLWFGEGKALKYIKLPDLGDNPYLWDLSDYVDEAELETSRYDAERPTHRKTLMECGVQSEDLKAGHREIEVYYEADRSNLWVLWGTITLSPYEKLYIARSDIHGSFVDNGGFETWSGGVTDAEPTGWDDYESISAGTGTNNRESTEVKEGSYALKIDVSGLNKFDYKGIKQNILNKLTVGRTYNLIVWVKNAAITNGDIFVRAYGDVSGLLCNALESGKANNEYTKYQGEFTVDAADTTLEIRVYIYPSENGCTGTVYIDRLTVPGADDPVVASGSTPSVIKVDDTTGMVAGEWVRIGTSHRQVKSVNSSTQFTVTLPFPNAPASGAIVYGGWPVVHEVALRFRGTTDDATKGWALCGFAGGWLPRPPREWSRTVILEIADGVVQGRSAAKMWEDLQALADRPEPIAYKDYWGNEYDVFVLEPQFKPLAEKEDAIDKHISRGYAVVRMLDATLS